MEPQWLGQPACRYLDPNHFQIYLGIFVRKLWEWVEHATLLVGTTKSLDAMFSWDCGRWLDPKQSIVCMVF